MLKLGICGTNNSHAVRYTGLVNQPHLPKQRKVAGARVVAFFAYDQENVKELRDLGVETQVDKMEDLMPLIDGVLCVTREGSKHLKEATPFLKAGIPTFVDKPLSTRLADARKIVELAKRHRTPLMSCSSLRYATEIMQLQKRMSKLGRLRAGTVTGMGETVFYGIHAAEMLVTVFGRGIDFVINIGPKGHDLSTVQYRDGKSVSLQIMRDAQVDWRVRVHCEKGLEEAVVTHGAEFYRNTMREMVKFFRTGKSPIDHRDTLEVIKVLTAMVKSRKTGGKVYLRDL